MNWAAFLNKLISSLITSILNFSGRAIIIFTRSHYSFEIGLAAAF